MRHHNRLDVGQRPGGVSLITLCLLCLALVACFTPILELRAGGPPLEFLKPLDKADSRVIASDSSGNFYLGGSGTPTVVKLSPEGDQLWAFGPASLAERQYIDVSSIVVVNPSQIYIAGTVSNLEKIGPFPVLGSNFFGRLNADGSIAFLKFFRGIELASNALTHGADGTFLLVGTVGRRSEVSYDGIWFQNSSSGSTGVVFKLNSDGSHVWHQRMIGDAQDYLDSVASAADGSVLVAGISLSTATGMSGVALSAAPRTESIVCFVMDPAGKGLSGKLVKSASLPAGPISSFRPIYGFGLAAYSPRSDAFVWAGNSIGSLTLGSTTMTNEVGTDVFVAKLARNGSVHWARALSSMRDAFATTMAADRFGNIYVGGIFMTRLGIGSLVLDSFGNRDLFVAKFRDDGTPAWIKQVGWTGDDTRIKLAITPADELMVWGAGSGGAVSVDGAFLQLPGGGTNGFWAKFQSEGAPPRFVSHPRSQVVTAGVPFTLSAEIEGGGSSPRYQWWFRAAPIPGETNRSLSVASAQASHAGNYRLVASNDGGSATSASAFITYSDSATVSLGIHPSLSIYGPVGHAYRVEYSTEMSDGDQWTTATNLTLTVSPTVWIDPTAAVGEKRFYRVVRIP